MCSPKWYLKDATLTKSNSALLQDSTSEQRWPKTRLNSTRSNFFTSTKGFNAGKAWACQKFIHAYKQMSLTINGLKHKDQTHTALTAGLLQGESSAQVGPAHLFQAELELSCRACRAAWNRGRSLRTGELMKRGRGLLNEPILWNWRAKDGATVNPPVIGSGGVEQGCQKVSSLEGPSVNLSDVNKSPNPRTQPAAKAKSQPWPTSSPQHQVVTRTCTARWWRNLSSPAKQRERKRARQRRERWKYPIPLAANLGKSSGVLQEQPPFPSCPLSNDPRQPARNTSMVSLSISISRDARTEVPKLFC